VVLTSGAHAPVLVVAQACQGCGACLVTCPEHALRAAAPAPVLVAARCTGCLECVEVCPVDAIHPAVRRDAG
jgi:electron transport complex protein RnfB